MKKKTTTEDNITTELPVEQVDNEHMIVWDDAHWKKWVNAKKFGDVVGESNLIACKTPLSTAYEKLYKSENSFTIDQLVQDHMKVNKSIGMFYNVVPNSKNYTLYEKSAFDDWDVKYAEIKVENNDILRFTPPTRQEVHTFIAAVDQFYVERPSFHVAVASTYGLNRAGFLIIAYLVERFRLPVDTAISQFATSNPPGVYSPLCIAALFRRYSKIKLEITEDQFKCKYPVPDWDKTVETEAELAKQFAFIKREMGESTEPDTSMKPPAIPNTDSEVLPKPWRKEYSKRMKRFYYFNPDTKKSVWSAEECK